TKRDVMHLLLAGASTVALAGGAAWLRQRFRMQRPVFVRPAPSERVSSAAARRVLKYFVVPVWIGVGLADWACHRYRGQGRPGGIACASLDARRDGRPG